MTAERGLEMEQTINVALTIAALVSTLAGARPACPHAAAAHATHARAVYSWLRAVPPGQGDWPRWLTPVAGPQQKLWMIGERAVWSSTDGVRFAQAQHDGAWGARYGAAYAYFNGRLWLLGGMERSWDNFKNDVWSSADGTHWTRATTNAGWTPRRGHTALVFNGRLWVLGGAASSGRPDQTPTQMLSDVWSSADGTNWTRVVDAAPWPGGEHNSVVFQNKLWVFGGGGAWHSTDGRNWTQTLARADWLDRGGNNRTGLVVFDGRIWTFGGWRRNDVWASADGTHWRQVAAHAPWFARATEHSVVFQERLWLYGGKTGGHDALADDVWFMQRGE